MQLILRLLAYAFALISMTILHLGVSYILPSPWSHVNSLFIVLSLILFARNSGSVIWMAFFAHLLIELYTTTPFGIVLYTSTIAMVIGYWLSVAVITNRSWYSLSLLTGMILLVYRLGYMLLLAVTQIVTNNRYNWSALLADLGWEWVFTTITVTIIAIILRLAHVRSFSPRIGKAYEEQRTGAFRY